MFIVIVELYTILIMQRCDIVRRPLDIIIIIIIKSVFVFLYSVDAQRFLLS